MSKLLAAFYGHNSVKPSQEPKPQEYTVLGVNQPLIAPENESDPQPAVAPVSLPKPKEIQRRISFSLLLNKLV